MPNGTDPNATDDARWLAAAAALAERARPLSRPNPAVGAIIVKDGVVVGRGWTQPGGRPHAEAVALAQAGEAARGATLYVTLEPCAHESDRGPDCAGLVVRSGLARVVVGVGDPDERTSGGGIEKIEAAGIAAEIVNDPNCRASLAGYFAMRVLKRPFVTLKLAVTRDGRLSLRPHEGRWITGEASRAHVHLERSRTEVILVGAGTLRTDNPRLDVRLPGLESRSPVRYVLTRGKAPENWHLLPSPEAISTLTDCQYLYVEGGELTADAFLSADLVDRVMIYTAPVLAEDGPSQLAALGLADLADNADWRLADRRIFAPDTLEIWDRVR